MSVSDPSVRARNVTAVLGPTNTGKTHLAIERMLAHHSGVIGLPLRLLAREVYGRIVARVGADQVALVTGEEKIKPANARYYVCTVEAMPRETVADFAAVDEIQIATDLERGHVFTDRILHLRGRQETLLLGAATMRPLIEKLMPGVSVVTRPRMSQLSYAGQKKITRLPRRSAIVAFSSDEVYAIAELIRRQRGGAAVVLGSLSPRTRNAQVALYQSGDVDFLVATDAIGMGLNLDVDHIAFASTRKFDGYQFRELTAAEMGQIAGRAGRHTRDGSFGVTARAAPFDDELVETMETYAFDPVQVLQWRNRKLDFSSLQGLKASLDEVPAERGLTRAPPAIDVVSLDMAARDPEIARLAKGARAVELLWEVCQIPDYRKIAPTNHVDLVTALYGFLARDKTIADDWFSRQVSYCDRTDGDIDTIANRIAHIRTWTFIANRPDWLADPAHWQERTRAIEDRLSDALHERLTQRFVDRRTSVLMRRLRESNMLEAEITSSGDVLVEGQHVGHLHGFRFQPDASADGPDGKAVRAAAQKSLTGEINRRAERLAEAPNEDIVLASDGALRWQGEVVAKLAAAADPLKPAVVLLADEQLAGAARERVVGRLESWLGQHVRAILKPLFDLAEAEDLAGMARGIAFRLVEALGVLDRQLVAEDVRGLEQEARAALRKYGVRFGAYHLYLPILMKPAPRSLAALLWALQNGGLDQPGLAELPHLAALGRTSIPVDTGFAGDLYRLVGYRVCGERAVRVDILERLADLIRPLIAWRGGAEAEGAPEGAGDGNGFFATVAMTSLVGCAGEDFASILRSLGYRSEKRRMRRRVRAAEAAPAEVAEVVEAPAETPAETPAEMPMATAAEPAPEATPAEGAEVVAEAPADAPAEAEAEAETATAKEPAAEPEAPVAAEEPVAEAIAGPGEAAETGTAPEAGDEEAAAAAAAAAEDEFEEVDLWRPGRGDRGPRREHHHGR
ncbi:MAG TPA: helicase-related protein, partial [Kaistiaceae bacterium]|nr:helicase-related protein [Kaistiaceae bacterium]